MTTQMTPEEILARYRTLVVVGISSDPSRPGHIAPNFMRNQGYRIVGVNPVEQEVFGEAVYPDLASVPEPVELVVVFRRPEQCAQVAQEAAAVGARVLWLQSGITSPEARRIAEEAGIEYVENRCVMSEHRRHHIGRVG